MAVEGPARTALNHFRRHCSEQNGNVPIVYGDLRDENACASRRLVPKTMASNLDCEMEKCVSSKPLGKTQTLPARPT